jgi:very-short-patch-repair endonuclease
MAHKKWTQKVFLKEVAKVHGEKYDYSKSVYKGNKINLTIICSEHGEFQQTPSNHLKGTGCMKCFRNTKKLGKEGFITKANKIHNGKYDYSKVVYLNNKKKVIIICPDHGEFQQTPNNHLKGSVCPECAHISRVDKLKSSKEEFIKNAKEVHSNKFDYSKVVYLNNKKKVIIICPEHGEFNQKPNTHLSGNGCHQCGNVESKGEKMVSDFLSENDIKYESQKRFDDCRYKSVLFFDFYLPELNVCIEYDGRQHFESVGYYGGDEGLKKRQIRDSVKNQYCKNKGIKLIRIKYDEDVCEKLKKSMFLSNNKIEKDGDS